MEIPQEYAVVPIRKLKAHPRNPNKGNVGVISESIEQNGFFGAVLAQRSTGYILAGNHRWVAGKEKGLKKIPVIWLDVDDEAALRIMLVDNRSAALSQTDGDLLASVLRSLPSHTGTGYSEADYKTLVGVVQSSQIDLDKVIPLHRQHQEAPPTKEKDPDPILDAPADIGGAFQLKPDMEFGKNGHWDFPPLRPEMLARPEDIPKNLKAWAGSATKDWPDPDQWWLYNFGVDSTSGMHDISKCVMSFFTFDEYFEPWWDRPDFWTSKMINSGIKVACNPQFSLYKVNPRIVSVFNWYRRCWMGRYFQEAGVKLIPVMGWPQDDTWFIENVTLPTLEGAPVLATELNSFDRHMAPEIMDRLADHIQYVVNTLKPEMLLFYAMEGGKNFMETLDLNTDLFYVESRMVALRTQHKERKTAKEKAGVI